MTSALKARSRYCLMLMAVIPGLGLLDLWAGEPETKPPAPAARLQIKAAEYKGAAAELLDPEAPGWDQAAAVRVLLNRTPRVYQTEPVPVGKAPHLEVRCLRSGGKLMVRMRWDDATMDAPKAPARKTGEGGTADVLYKRPTAETAAFADAAAVMMPDHWTGKEFPSLVMGDKKAPVRIWYWNASRGTEELSATGRATQSPIGKSFAHRAKHADGKWTLTMELSEPAEGCPMAFAVWDGHAKDRDGLKYFSIWYVLVSK